MKNYYFLVMDADKTFISQAKADFSADPKGEAHFLRSYASNVLYKAYPSATVIYIGRKAPKTLSFSILEKGNTRVLDHLGAQVLGHNYEEGDV